jgi:hypothetical protein
MVCTIAIAAGLVLGSIPFGYGSRFGLLLSAEPRGVVGFRV